MTARRGTALAVCVVAVFALVTVSIVESRASIDTAVERSFVAAAGDARLAPVGCTKRSLSIYRCHAVTASGSATVPYRLWLEDDGCWTAGIETETPPPAPRKVRGCVAG